MAFNWYKFLSEFFIFFLFYQPYNHPTIQCYDYWSEGFLQAPTSFYALFLFEMLVISIQI